MIEMKKPISEEKQKELDRRYDLIDQLASKDTDDMDLEDLRQFFYSHQFVYYENEYFSSSIEELEELIKERNKLEKA